MSKPQQQCLWNAFGDFSCTNKVAPLAGNIFARSQPRADWEMFAQEQEQPSTAAAAAQNPVASFAARFKGAPLVAEKAEGKKEGFCGCQGAAPP
jgi:hypothetical protein